LRYKAENYRMLRSLGKDMIPLSETIDLRES